MFAMASQTILSTVDTIRIHRHTGEYVADWRHNGLFIASLVSTLVITFILVCVGLFYMCYFHSKVNKEDIAKPHVFEREQWVN